MTTPNSSQTTLAILEDTPEQLPKAESRVTKFPRNYTVREHVLDDEFLTGQITFAQGKMLHALLLVCEAYGWEPPYHGMFDVDAAILDRITRRLCKNKGFHVTHEEKRQQIEGWDVGIIGLIRQLENIEINLEALHKFNLAQRELDPSFDCPDEPEFIGDLRLVTEVVAADPKKDRSYSRLMFRIPEILLDNFFKKMQWGKVDVEALFSIKSEFAFYAYMYAGLRLIDNEKTGQNTFFSKSYPIAKWARILHFDTNSYDSEWKIRSSVFKRITKYILAATATTDRPLYVTFLKAKSGHQMRIEIIKSREQLLKLCKDQKLTKVVKQLTSSDAKTSASVRMQQKAINKVRNEAEEREAIRIAEEQRLAMEVHKHPLREAIYERLGKHYTEQDPRTLDRITVFSLLFALSEIEGVDYREFGLR